MSATHTIRIWTEKGKAPRNLAPGTYAGATGARGAWIMSTAHDDEAAAVRDVIAQLKASGETGRARIERADDDRSGGRVNYCRKPWQAKRQRPNATLRHAYAPNGGRG